MAPDPEGFVKLWRRLLKHPLWKSANSNAKVLFIHILLTVNWKAGKWLYESTVMDINPGERIGSSNKIAAELGLSRQEFRHAVQVLQELEILAKTPIKPTSIPSLNNQGTQISENLEIVARDATRNNGKRYTRLTLINWDRWQGLDEPEGKPSQPEIKPDLNQTATRPQPDCNQTATTIKEGKKLRREEGEEESQTRSPKNTANGWREVAFYEFWERCVWAKIGKGKALRKYREKATTPELAGRINAAAKEQAPRLLAEWASRKARDPESGVLHPATWLGDGRWDDEIPKVQSLDFSGCGRPLTFGEIKEQRQQAAFEEQVRYDLERASRRNSTNAI